MTKQHFIALADTVKDWNGNHQEPYFTPAHLEVLANFCAEQNPRFNRQRWLDYISGKCGPNGGKP